MRLFSIVIKGSIGLCSHVKQHPLRMWDPLYVFLQDFSRDFSDLDGVVQQRRQEMMESSSSGSQTPDYDKITGVCSTILILSTYIPALQSCLSAHSNLMYTLCRVMFLLFVCQESLRLCEFLVCKYAAGLQPSEI